MNETTTTTKLNWLVIELNKNKRSMSEFIGNQILSRHDSGVYECACACVSHFFSLSLSLSLSLSQSVLYYFINFKRYLVTWYVEKSSSYMNHQVHIIIYADLKTNFFCENVVK
jgi:hypothetical protein